jgi:hypothetical protein
MDRGRSIYRKIVTMLIGTAAITRRFIPKNFFFPVSSKRSDLVRSRLPFGSGFGSACPLS